MGNSIHGFIYSATHLKYLREAEQSVISLKQSGNNQPVSIMIPPELDKQIDNRELFDQILIKDDLYSYSAKIDALLNSPYQKTVFLDGDTVIASELSELFELLDFYDLGVCPERNASHAVDSQHKNIGLLKDVLHEFNTGVIALKKSNITQNFLNTWKKLFNEYQPITNMDQVSFRLATIQSDIRIAALPNEYNFRGLTSFQIAMRKVKILHERLGGIRDSNRKMEDLLVVLKKVQKINKYHSKRMIFSLFGNIVIIPYKFSPDNIMRSVFNKVGLMKRVKKRHAIRKK